MKKYLLPETGHFYKANLHAHSTISDGTLTPEEMKAAYKAHGYSVLSITDHDLMVPHHDLTDPDFLMLTGFEMDMEEGFDKPLDVLTTQMLSEPFLRSIRPEEVLIYAS